jgi:hypothetical protein
MRKESQLRPSVNRKLHAGCRGTQDELGMVGAALLGVCLSVLGWERSSIDVVCRDICSFGALESWKGNR